MKQITICKSKEQKYFFINKRIFLKTLKTTFTSKRTEKQNCLEKLEKCQLEKEEFRKDYETKIRTKKHIKKKRQHKE